MEQTKVQSKETPKEVTFTKEEINKRDQVMLDFYRRQIKKLELQIKFEKMRMEVAEYRLKEFNYTTTLNMLIAKTQEGLVETPEELVKEQTEPEEKPNLKVVKDEK